MTKFGHLATNVQSAEGVMGESGDLDVVVGAAADGG